MEKQLHRYSIYKFHLRERENSCKMKVNEQDKISAVIGKNSAYKLRIQCICTIVSPRCERYC